MRKTSNSRNNCPWNMELTAPVYADSGRKYRGFLQSNSLAFSRDCRTLASGGRDGQVRLWNVATGQELIALRNYRGAERALATFSPDAKMLATAFQLTIDRSQLLVWSIETE
jgi:WD40 repeat protein